MNIYFNLVLIEVQNDVFVVVVVHLLTLSYFISQGICWSFSRQSGTSPLAFDALFLK